MYILYIYIYIYIHICIHATTQQQLPNTWGATNESAAITNNDYNSEDKQTGTKPYASTNTYDITMMKYKKEQHTN